MATTTTKSHQIGDEVTATKNIQILETEARELAATLVLVATNDGTFGAAESLRCTGNGDTKSATRNVYERIGDGVISSNGPSHDDAPGRMRQINSEAVNQLRAKLRSLREQIKAAR